MGQNQETVFSTGRTIWSLEDGKSSPKDRGMPSCPHSGMRRLIMHRLLRTMLMTKEEDVLPEGILSLMKLILFCTFKFSNTIQL